MSDLQGLRVLVLEDEALVSMMLEGMLEDIGCAIVGPFLHLDAAMAHVQSHTNGIDAALIDINVGGQRSLPLADLLHAHGVPFAFCTGYDAGGVAEPYRDAPRLAKPYVLDDVASMLRRIAQR